jgi:L-lactate dehydrogenase (cytochrome)
MLDAVLLRPSILHGEITPDTSTTFLGQHFPVPVGVAPVGMSGLIWPDAERTLARMARDKGVPYCMSSVATRLPEEMSPHLGQHAWFQLYPPRDVSIRQDMLKRVKDAGFTTLVLTVDVPAPSRRERQTRGGLTQPPKLSPRLMAQVARCPNWAMGTARLGMPRMRFVESYADTKISNMSLPSNAHVGYLLRTSPSWDYLAELRKEWEGPIIIKGVQNPDDAARIQDEGADAIWISNHAGRQFDAAPATAEVVAGIRAATTLPIIADSGVESGLDVLRMLALGADFVMLGRAFHYGLGAYGADGSAHVIDIIQKDMVSCMHQLGQSTIEDLSSRIFANSVG